MKCKYSFLPKRHSLSWLLPIIGVVFIITMVDINYQPFNQNSSSSFINLATNNNQSIQWQSQRWFAKVIEDFFYSNQYHHKYKLKSHKKIILQQLATQDKIAIYRLFAKQTADNPIAYQKFIEKYLPVLLFNEELLLNTTENYKYLFIKEYYLSTIMYQELIDKISERAPTCCSVNYQGGIANEQLMLFFDDFGKSTLPYEKQVFDYYNQHRHSLPLNHQKQSLLLIAEQFFKLNHLKTLTKYTTDLATIKQLNNLNPQAEQSLQKFHPWLTILIMNKQSLTKKLNDWLASSTKPPEHIIQNIDNLYKQIKQINSLIYDAILVTSLQPIQNLTNQIAVEAWHRHEIITSLQKLINYIDHQSLMNNPLKTATPQVLTNVINQQQNVITPTITQIIIPKDQTDIIINQQSYQIENIDRLFRIKKHQTTNWTTWFHTLQVITFPINKYLTQQYFKTIYHSVIINHHINNRYNKYPATLQQITNRYYTTTLGGGAAFDNRAYDNKYPLYKKPSTEKLTTLHQQYYLLITTHALSAAWQDSTFIWLTDQWLKHTSDSFWIPHQSSYNITSPTNQQIIITKTINQQVTSINLHYQQLNIVK